MKLRRKLVLIFGSLVVLMLATAVGAIWILQDVLKDLHHLDTQAWTVIGEANKLVTNISRVEIELHDLEIGRTRHLDALIDLAEQMTQQIDRVQQSYVVREPENAPLMRSLVHRVPRFTSIVGLLATAQDPEWAAQYRRDASSLAVQMRRDIFALSRSVGAHGEAEQADLTQRFRWMVLGLTVVFLVLINVSVVTLVRMAGLVLRPVEKLVDATRQLADEHFDYRVELDQNDEFDELANAYNSLASQLQSNEQRRLEMLGQVALTLNHELNNAAAIIELQLQLVKRQSEGNQAIEKYARQIRESLDRMTRTVDALKRVRRIVLTDYIAGMKMLDLERSTEDAAEHAQ